MSLTSGDNRKVSIELPRSAVLWTLGIRMSSDNRKVSIELPRSAVFWTPGTEMSSDNRKVSIELPRSAVLQECQNTAKVRSFMDTFAWQPKSVHKTAKVRSFSMIFSTVLENV